MDSRARIQQLRGLLGDREIVYIGPRGADALPLRPLRSPRAICSLTAPVMTGVPEVCLEELKGARVDLNSYAFDDDHSSGAQQFRLALRAMLAPGGAIIPYSPVPILSAVRLTVRNTLALGLFYEEQTCFEYKPWVEREVAKWGVGTLPWNYVQIASPAGLAKAIDVDRSLVVRLPRSRGGSGIWLVESPADLDRIALPPNEIFVCVSPYYADAVSVNVNACTFPDGKASFHGISVQLVGVGACTTRSLGYCGNDFARVRDLPAVVLERLDGMVRVVAKWLAGRGYLGAFGVDALVVDERVLFVELNPRFQASSAVAAELDETLGRANQYFEHIAAFLSLDPADRMSLRDVVEEQPSLSQVVVYNGRPRYVVRDSPPQLEARELRLLPRCGLAVAPQAVIASIVWDGAVTATGRELSHEVDAAVHLLVRSFVDADGLESRLTGAT